MKRLLLLLFAAVLCSCVIQRPSTSALSQGQSNRLDSKRLEQIVASKSEIVERTNRIWPGKISADWTRDYLKRGDLLIGLYQEVISETRPSSAFAAVRAKEQLEKEAAAFYEAEVQKMKERMRRDPMASGLAGHAELIAADRRLDWINGKILNEVEAHADPKHYEAWKRVWERLDKN